MGKLRIDKKAHKRKSYKKKSGVRVKKSKVKRAVYYAKDRGKKGRGKKVIRITKPGSLKEFGYQFTKPRKQRRIALKKIATHIKKGGVRKGEEQKWLGKVGIGTVFFKRTNPRLAKVSAEDKKYLSELVER